MPQDPTEDMAPVGPELIRGVRARTRTTVTATLAETWAAFVPIDLSEVFPSAKGPIPAVTGTSGQTGRWDVVGNARNVHLGDGAVVREQITFSDPADGKAPTGRGARFCYAVGGFTGPLGWIAREAHGEWVFSKAGERTTQIVWTYTFVPRNALAAIPLRLVIGTFWQAYMRDAIENVRRIVAHEVSLG